MSKIEKLEKEIQRLEEQLEKNRFGGLFDKVTREREEKKLRKLKKELEKLAKA
ncbi:MAG: hypothetical protein ABIJ45_08965 [Candidatus Zixiibacteriota bacterium]